MCVAAHAYTPPPPWPALPQVEVSTCGCQMLSATFFRSAFDKLFYMIRTLRSPLPRTLQYLPALIHEHVVCEIPETGRSWRVTRSLTG